MKRKDYFLAAMRAGSYRYRAWVFDAFGYQEEVTEPPKANYPWPLWRTAEGYMVLDPVTGEQHRLEETVDTEPAFEMLDGVDLVSGDVSSLKEKVITTYGNILYNYMTLIYSVGDKIPFQIDEIKPGKLEKFFFNMESTPEEGAKRDPDKIYVDEYMKFHEGIRYTEEFADLCVPSATPVNLVTDPKIPELRAKLLADADKAGKLKDPAEEARITGELIKMDKSWVNSDPEGGFFTKDKSFNVTRKKMHLIQGTEQGFEASPDANMIEQSLEDGWDINKLPEMNNSLRNGSFSRGAETAQGGEIVKTLLRITQNTTIGEEDCGSKMGLPTLITKDNAKRYVDRFYIGANKKPVYIDEKSVEGLVGKVVELRSAWSCKTDGYKVCATCMGKKLAETPKAIGVYVSDVGSAFLTSFLKRMHGQSRSTKHFDLKERIS
ncbi:MAG TPA: hypothetical protein VN081_01130 [Dongiaceae bacterium]|nr:hypothetical protein [Dongiaceae bacterium]